MRGSDIGAVVRARLHCRPANWAIWGDSAGAACLQPQGQPGKGWLVQTDRNTAAPLDTGRCAVPERKGRNPAILHSRKRSKPAGHKPAGAPGVRGRPAATQTTPRGLCMRPGSHVCLKAARPSLEGCACGLEAASAPKRHSPSLQGCAGGLVPATSPPASSSHLVHQPARILVQQLQRELLHPKLLPAAHGRPFGTADGWGGLMGSLRQLGGAGRVAPRHAPPARCLHKRNFHDSGSRSVTDGVRQGAPG